jgi:hypothetical protein
MKISQIKTTLINIPFVAPVRWAGGVEAGGSRCMPRWRQTMASSASPRLWAARLQE